MKKIVIDKTKCIGCFKCKQVCYSCFEVGSDGKAKVRYGREHDVEEAKTAEICCPTGAISIVEESIFSRRDDEED
ncbi:MAG TPA: hypothetical protein DCY94_04340, partial [Firmicutes bacterium]|nr:hypothetical protein [Bacillota bacterium]